MKTRFAPSARMLIVAIQEIVEGQGTPCTWATLNDVIFIYNEAGDAIGRVYRKENPDAQNYHQL